MVTAKFQEKYSFTAAYGLWQYNYGDTLRIEGLKLPPATEIHFSLQETGGESETRVGITKDGATEVCIPDAMLEDEDTTIDYAIYAYIYLTDDVSGRTVYKIKMPVKSRPKPSDFGSKGSQELFREAIQAVNDAAAQSEASATLAQSYAVGGTDTREGEDTDNAKYYAGQAADSLKGVSGAVEEGKKDIDQYIKGKEAELKGETGNVNFAAFAVENGRLKMYSDPSVDKVCFKRRRSRLAYRLQIK